MKRAYSARSNLAHGEEAPDLKLPDGSPATLDDYVEIAADYMRKSLRWLISRAAASESSPISDWDEFTFSRL